MGTDITIEPMPCAASMFIDGRKGLTVDPAICEVIELPRQADLRWRKFPSPDRDIRLTSVKISNVSWLKTENAKTMESNRCFCTSK